MRRPRQSFAQAAAPLCLFALAAPCLANGKPKADRSSLGNLRDATGSVSVKVDRNRAFVANFAIGTPPQTLKCLIDSGSADLWVPSKKCENCGGAEDHFYAQKSSTFAPKMYHTPHGPKIEEFKVTYGSGVVAGYGVQDTVTFGSWQVKNQTFIIVEDQQLPQNLNWDGIFGLGWSGLSNAGKPIYKRMQEAGHPAIFSLVPVEKGKADVVLGELPNAQIKQGTLAWEKALDLNLPRKPGEGKKSFWVISGGVAITKQHPRMEKFLVDTGTNQMLLVPTKWYRGFISSLLPPKSFEQHCGMDAGMGGLIICECSIGQSGNLPPLRFYFGGRHFDVPVQELFRKVDAKDGGQDLCMLEIQPNDMGPQGLDGMLGGLLPSLLDGMLPGALGMGGQASASPPPGAGLLGGGGPPSSAPPHAEAKMAGPAGPPMGLPAFPGFKGLPMPPLPENVKPGENIEEIVRRGPDGKVCTTTIISKPGAQPTKTTKCVQSRRLQQGMPVIAVAPGMQGQPIGIMQPIPVQQPGGAMPIMPVPLAIPAEVEANPMGDLWVLGGVFMEKFVTVFDFDNSRVGVAEPLNEVSGLANYQQQSAQQTFMPPAAASAAVPAASAAAALPPAPAAPERAAAAALGTGQGQAAAPAPGSTAGAQPQRGAWLGVAGIVVAIFVAVALAGFFVYQNGPWRRPRNASAAPSEDEEDAEPGE